MLAEELAVHDGDSPSWRAARPLLDAALRLERGDDVYTWHGWNKQQLASFLASLPPSCSLVVGVWETVPGEGDLFGTENLALGLVCEVLEGEVCSIRTFEALATSGLKTARQLEPGYEDALEIMRVARAQVAPVAWALFTDRETWNGWLFAAGDGGTAIDKGELLASLTRRGRCVLMGSRAAHHHHS